MSIRVKVEETEIIVEDPATEWRVSYRHSTGVNGLVATQIPYVSGFQGGLTAVKRLDPLVAFAGVSYYSEISGFVVGSPFDPSDVISSRLGASLAVTPTTSLSAGFNISFLTETPRFPGPRPDDVVATVDLGFNTLLWSRTFLSTKAQFGLTGDVPDFRLITSVPVRF